MRTYKFKNGNIITMSGILKDTIITNRKCKTVLPIGNRLIKTTEDALTFLDTLWLHGEFDDFRDCVQFWLKATAYRKGLNYVLKITGLSKASYYRGVSYKQKRKNSDFDKYLAGLEPVKVVFDTMRKKYENDVMQNKYFDTTNFYDSNYPTTFVLGARGAEKTVSLACLIKKSYKDKTKFVYLRRYQEEIDTLGLPLRLLSKLTGLDVTIDHIKDDSGRSSKMIMVQGENDEKPIGVGYLLALSDVSKYKSSDYSGVWIILYDEFIDINGGELKNEVDIYLNFAMTVFRDFSKYRSIFLASTTNLHNSYFVKFNFYPSGAISKNKELGIKIVMYRKLNKRNKLPLAKML